MKTSNSRNDRTSIIRKKIYQSVIALLFIAVVLLLTSPVFDTATTITFAILLSVCAVGTVFTAIDNEESRFTYERQNEKFSSAPARVKSRKTKGESNVSPKTTIRK